MKRVGSDACSFLGTVCFNCLQSHGTHWPDTAVVVFRKSSERICLKVCFFCRVFSFFLYFYEGGCIPNILNVVHNPKITLDVKMKVQVCISAIAVSFIKDSAAEHSQW